MTKTPTYFLVIDQGTQSIRALIFDLNGNLIAKEQIKIEAYFSKEPGWAEQEPEYFWKQLSRVCQNLWSQGGISPESILAMAVTTQRGSMVNLDVHGRPLRPAILWLDQRLSTEYRKIPWYWRFIFFVIRQSDAVQFFQQKAPANWIKQYQPEIWEKTNKYLLLSGYLTYRLTGEMKESIGSVVGYLPFNFRKHRWAGKFDWKWHVVPVTRRQLPELVPTGSFLGHIHTEAALATGLPEGLEVYASAADKACEVLGSGGISPNIGCISFGTTATFNSNLSKYIEPMSFIPPFPSAIAGQFNAEVMIYRGFWMVSWFKEHFGLAEVLQAEEMNKEAEELFDNLVSQVPAGSDGLLLQPYWSPGLKNLEARGAMIGFSDHHTRAHFYRAIIEGIVYALREGKELLERKHGVPITEIVVSGGGSQSDSAMQICADVFNMKITRPHTFETSGLGAAIQLAVATKQYPDYQEACARMVHVGNQFLPNAQSSTKYDWIYRHLYRPLYSRLKPLYRALFLSSEH